MRVLSAVVGGIGAVLGGAFPAVFLLASLVLTIYSPVEGGVGVSAYLLLVLATLGGTSACYLAALAGAWVTLWGRGRLGAALMTGGALGAAASGVAYVLLLDDVMHPAPPVYPSWPGYAIFYFLPIALLFVAASVALAGRPSESAAGA